MPEVGCLLPIIVAGGAGKCCNELWVPHGDQCRDGKIFEAPDKQRKAWHVWHATSACFPHSGQRVRYHTDLVAYNNAVVHAPARVHSCSADTSHAAAVFISPSCTQERLDPIDWATYEPYLWANEAAAQPRTAVLFGALARLGAPARLEPGRGQKQVSTYTCTDLHDEVCSTCRCASPKARFQSAPEQPSL